MKMKYLILSIAVAATVLTGCQKAAEYTPSIYITEAQVDKAKTLKVSQVGQAVEFSVSSSLTVTRDTHISLEIVPELLEEYNKTYGRQCELLQDYEFLKKEVVIKEGKNVSDASEVVVNQVLEIGKFYCLPVKIVNTDGTMPVLEPSSVFYLVFRAPVKSKAIYLGSGNKYTVPLFYNGSYKPAAGEPDLSKLEEVSLECRVMARSFVGRDPYISSIMGLEGNVCVRFGDVKIGKDVVQVCNGDYQPAAIQTPCAENTWYHIAAVWTRTSLKIYIDGKFITETPHGGEKVNLTHKPDGTMQTGFNIGAASVYQSGRPLDGYVAEARVWTRALNGSEIANLKELVTVDPQSPGLLAYWKMNEAESAPRTNYLNPVYYTENKVVDITGHGFDAFGNSKAENISTIETDW